MKKHFFILLYSALIFFGVAGCRESYEPAVIKSNVKYLVVEGVINTSPNSVTTIRLSRTRNVTDSVVTSPESGARVQIISKAGNIYPLQETDAGTYVSNEITLNPSNDYAVDVITSGNSEYLSDFVTPKQTPAIDSLQWQYKNNGVTIYLNTHDPQNNTRYYRWEYVETWEYRARYESEIGLENGLMFYIIDQPLKQKYRCWHTANSTNITLGSSVALAQDVISQDSITNISQNDDKIGVRYSILIKQFALTQEAYEYWQLLQKNTQQLGSLFDAQPSQLTGNIKCVTNPAEPVIGYISASSSDEKRIFIRNNELPNWNAPGYQGQGCADLTIEQNTDNYLLYNYPDTSYAPYFFSGTTGLRIAKKSCLDCTLSGGTNIQPTFW